VLLYLLSNTHLLGMLMAGGLHLYFLYNRRKEKKNIVSIHSLVGPLIVLTGVYFIFPPSDSEMNVRFWLSRWGSRNFINFGQAPLRAFMPVPAWWKYNFWNTQFIIDGVKGNTFLMIGSVCISVFIVTCLIVVLRKRSESQVLFCGNLLFSFVVAMTFFTLGSARYAGFLYIAFIAAYWLYCYKTTPVKNISVMVNVFLVVQLCAGIVPVERDIRYPFSNAYRVNELLVKVPPGQQAVTDYWALNVIAAFADRPFYCIDLQKELFFLKWDGELKSKIFNPSRYTEGLNNYFRQKGISRVYLLSTVAPPVLLQIDEHLSKFFDLKLVDKMEGAIESASNLYLYEINKAGS
jgi:hypothetical protein